MGGSSGFGDWGRESQLSSASSWERGKDYLSTALGWP